VAAGIKGALGLPGDRLMRLLFNAAVLAASLALAPAAVAQTAPASASPVSAPANPAAAVPVTLGKRMACRAASLALQGQDRRDQIELCMEQARLDCLKQAIAQQIVDAQRKEFVKSCME
jgi:Spy/CpxP family protein refolding chaperone